MSYLIVQIVLCLAAAAVVGVIVGWWLRSSRVREEVAAIEGDWALNNQTLTRQRDRLQIAYDQATLGAAALERENDARGVRLRELEAERDSVASIAASSQANLAVARKKLTDAEARAAEHAREIESLHRELSAKSMAVETLQTELSVAQDRRVRHDEDLQAARNQIARLESSQRRESERFEGLVSERDRLLAERDSLSGALVAAQSDIEDARDTLASLRRQAAGFQELAQSANDEVDSRRSRELERLLQIERNQSAMLREELREQSQRLALLEDGQSTDRQRARRVEELEEQLDDLDRDTERLRRELHEATERENTLRTEIERLELRLAAGSAEPAAIERSTGLVVEAEAAPLAVERPDWLLTTPQGEVDDLKRIRGVGPVLERTMHELGIYHFRQIARWGNDEIEWASHHLKAFPSRIERDRWVEQALELHREKYGDPPL